MKQTELNSPLIEEALSPIIDAFINSELISLITELKDKNTDLNPCSNEYLKYAMTKSKDYGFPLAAYGSSMTDSGPQFNKFYDECNNTYNRIAEIIGTPGKALAMIYPKGGYIGWHHNGNAPGHNILLTYSETGEGSFTYWDWDKQEEVVLQDNKGWNVRYGYYPNQDVTDKVFWHKAETECNRITLAFIIHDEDFWLDALCEMTGNEDFKP